jgi:long-chain fatty acid transport protein
LETRAAEPRAWRGKLSGKDAQMRKSQRRALASCAWTATLCLWCAAAAPARAQSYGIELQNAAMPISGAMGGASIARPQDILSAMNENPAALASFSGTHFTFGGTWAEATYNITQLVPLPLVGVEPFSAKSNQPGGAIGNIGVTQELTGAPVPTTFGMALITSAGAGVDFRGVPESNGTSAQYLCLDIVPSLGMQVSDNLSVGAAFTLGTGFLDGPFSAAGGMATAYGIRGTLGMQLALTETSWMGAFYQTKKHFHFEDVVVFGNGQSFDLPFDHPENVGLGIASNGLMEGRLLLAADVIFKQYSNADFLQSIYNNQWVYQFGAQYTVGPKLKIRAGYSYNTNPMRGPTVTEIEGIPLPDGIPAGQYIKGQFAAIPHHHLTGGIGVSNVLPGVDLDMLAGGMFRDSQQFSTTIASVESYWIGSYLTWRFGAQH